MAVTVTARRTLSDDAISSLRSQVSGSVLLPGDAGYDTARSIFNASFDR